MDPRRVVIMGAAGRDFHDFNVVFRNDPGVQVVAFTPDCSIRRDRLNPAPVFPRSFSTPGSGPDSSWRTTEAVSVMSGLTAEAGQ